MNETKIIYTLKMRLALHKEGIEPAFDFPNPKNPKFTSWVYERTPEFNKAFNKIYNAEKELKKNGKVKLNISYENSVITTQQPIIR